MSTIKKRYFLYELIDKMTPTEKRYFKIISANHILGTSNNYVTLFDIISEHREVRLQDVEDVVKEVFIKETGKKRFDLYKANLYDKLLNCLEMYHKNKNITSRIKAIVNQIGILMRKDLPEQVEQLILKGKRLCVKYEKWILLLELVEIDRDYRYNYQNPSLNNEEEQEIISKLMNVCEYRSIQSEMWKLYIENGLPTDDIAISKYDKLGQRRLIQDESQAITLESEFLRLYLLQFYSGMKMELNKTCEYGQKLVGLMEEEQHFLQDKAVLYIRSVCNLQYAYIRLRDLEGVIQSIEKCKWAFEELVVPPAFEITITLSLYINEYDARQLSDFSLDQSALMNNMNEFVSKHKSKMTQPSIILYYWQNVMYNFTHENYRECLDWLQKINYTKGGVRQDIQALSSMLILVVYYELDHDILLRYATINTYRSLLKKENKLDRLELSLLHFLKTELSISNRTRQQRKASFVILKEELKFINDHEASHEALKLRMVYQWVAKQ